jgi:hypothetical protein
MADAVETWIDTLCKVFNIDDGRGGQIHSFVIFEKNELPAAITPELIPCAVSYVSDVQFEYSTGGPTIFYWNGQTEFHLTSDVKPANIAYIMPFFGRIFAAAAQQAKLSNKVELFQIPNNTPGVMLFATYKNADGHDDHQGIVVKWFVKQNLSGQYVISA